MKRLKQIGLAAVAVLVIVAVALSFTPWGPVRVVRVDGRSMEPTLHDGDRLLCVRRPWKAGSPVVAAVDGGLIVKRIRYVGNEGKGRPISTPAGLVSGPGRRCSLMGDNIWNSEARFVFDDQIRGVVVHRLWPWNQEWKKANDADWARFRTLSQAKRKVSNGYNRTNTSRAAL